MRGSAEPSCRRSSDHGITFCSRAALFKAPGLHWPPSRARPPADRPLPVRGNVAAAQARSGPERPGLSSWPFRGSPTQGSRSGCELVRTPGGFLLRSPREQGAADVDGRSQRLYESLLFDTLGSPLLQPCQDASDFGHGRATTLPVPDTRKPSGLIIQRHHLGPALAGIAVLRATLPISTKPVSGFTQEKYILIQSRCRRAAPRWPEKGTSKVEAVDRVGSYAGYRPSVGGGALVRLWQDVGEWLEGMVQ